MYWVYKNSLFLSNLFFKLNIFDYFILSKNTSFFISKNNIKKFEIDKKHFYSKSVPLKYLIYFNKIFVFKDRNSKLNQLDYYGKYKTNNFYSFNNYNFLFYKKAINLVLEVSKQNFNLIILDKSYKHVFPLYNYIFKLKNVLTYKKYFFINSYFFTYANWYYYYNKFIKKFNVALLIILDFYYFNKFFKMLRKMNLPLVSLVPINNSNDFVDYPLFVFSGFNLEKFLLLNLITQLILLNFNYKNYNNKIKFLKIFYSFYTNTLF